MDNWSRKRKASEAGQNTTEKKAYDVLSDAPRELDVVKYAESHANEIQVLSSKVELVGGGRNVAQKIPIHMRRRAMSHNVKRLPRSIQAQAAHLIGAKVKKQSRYHRRRPKNLMQEYTRRQRKHIWLETHIWHAKRFHMIEKYGYKLPWKPTMKSERACYRATSRHCLLQDISYMSCIELEGPQHLILDGLSHLTSPDTGRTFAAVSCLSGTREGQTSIYEYDNYPWNAIGPVSFMWKPLATSETSDSELGPDRQLWIWCHPAIFHQIWQQLVQCLKLEETKPTTDLESEKKIGDISHCKTAEGDKERPFICDEYKTIVVAQNAGTQLKMKSLTGSLLRFRLTGPQSTAVLTDTLQQANIVPLKYPDENGGWWKDYYDQSECSLGHVTQREFMESMEECQSPSELPPHCVVAMTVRDPRLTRPENRTKVVVDENKICQDMSSFREKLSEAVAISPLWISSIREEICTTKLSDYKIHELKSENLIPGFPLELGDEESRIPVIVIQRPGVSNTTHTGGQGPNLGRGSGYDLVLPKGWGMAFWLALVFRGARSAGLREEECNAYEEKSLLFPNGYPDTQAGHQFQVDLEKEKVDKYNRVPPAKRPNYTKYGIVSPFYCPWGSLVKEWNDQNSKLSKKYPSKVQSKSKVDHINGMNGVKEETEQIAKDTEKEVDFTVKRKVDEGHNEGDKETYPFYVLRNKKFLRQLQNFCEVRGHKQKNKCNSLDVLAMIENEHSDCIVAVRLDMVQKGCPGEFSTICVPSPADIEQCIKTKTYSGPVEAINVDPALVEKQRLKKEMKQKGVKGKVKVDRNLKLFSEKQGVVVRSGSRDVIGYLNSGGYSLGTGNGGGVGFVSGVGLARWLGKCKDRDCEPLLLVRGNSTLQYRFARFSVLLG